MARRVPASFSRFSRALKLSKGQSCNRKAILRAVKAGASPEDAVKRNCGGGSSRRSGGRSR